MRAGVVAVTEAHLFGSPPSAVARHPCSCCRAPRQPASHNGKRRIRKCNTGRTLSRSWASDSGKLLTHLFVLTGLQEEYPVVVQKIRLPACTLHPSVVPGRSLDLETQRVAERERRFGEDVTKRRAEATGPSPPHWP